MNKEFKFALLVVITYFILSVLISVVLKMGKEAGIQISGIPVLIIRLVIPFLAIWEISRLKKIVLEEINGKKFILYTLLLLLVVFTIHTIINFNEIKTEALAGPVDGMGSGTNLAGVVLGDIIYLTLKPLILFAISYWILKKTKRNTSAISVVSASSK